LRREDIFKPTAGNDSLNQDSSDNGVRIVNFATSENVVVKSTMLQHHNYRTFTSTSPDGKTHNQTDHILIDRRWHSSTLDVRSFRGDDCDNDQYPMVAKVRERLAVSKQEGQTFDVERFNLKKIRDLDVMKQYHIKISNGFPVLENLNNSECTNRAWENTKENIKTSAVEILGLYELKH
jgi:hypothetical protein